MKKIILVAISIALLAGSPVAFSVSAAADDTPTHGNHQASGERGALLDAWFGGLKTGLKLTADQEKNWAAFENAVRGVAKTRADRFHEWREHEDDAARPSLVERLRLRSDRLAQRSTELKIIADAATPLYSSLDDGQKRTFGVLFHVLSREVRHGGRRRRGGAH